MAVISKRISLTILCLLMILTGCTTQNSENKSDQTTLLKPKVVIEEFFNYYSHKDLKGMNSLTTQRHHFSEAGWEFDNLDYIRVINIVEDTSQSEKEIHIRNVIHGKEKNYIIDMDKEKLELENVIIFKVEFEVKYIKEGVGASDSGRDNYYYILVRKDKNSPWLIDGYGH
ncbi:DUF4829 domain-containing protein [Clostridium sp.]